MAHNPFTSCNCNNTYRVENVSFNHTFKLLLLTESREKMVKLVIRSLSLGIHDEQVCLSFYLRKNALQSCSPKFLQMKSTLEWEVSMEESYS